MKFSRLTVPVFSRCQSQSRALARTRERLPTSVYPSVSQRARANPFAGFANIIGSTTMAVYPVNDAGFLVKEDWIFRLHELPADCRFQSVRHIWPFTSGSPCRDIYAEVLTKQQPTRPRVALAPFVGGQREDSMAACRITAPKPLDAEDLVNQAKINHLFERMASFLSVARGSQGWREREDNKQLSAESPRYCPVPLLCIRSSCGARGVGRFHLILFLDSQPHNTIPKFWEPNRALPVPPYPNMPSSNHKIQ
ncbi:unnamed protein product [Schistocephalus solidus]|uniref:Uncharacterized protein n=1 Tax=Schistocephalus solidus TaxID=70667 RepID=A0A183SWI1_SCHSO|nr:unnamed protein product [Schistocephalus solidus]